MPSEGGHTPLDPDAPVTPGAPGADAAAADARSPRVSIVMPVCNGERFLAETLASVQAQTMTDYELLLIDDGSTDGSLAIAEAHAAHDPRVRILQLDHGGIVAARNRALEVARAPLIALWDGDDLCVPERLAVQLAFLDANPDVGLLSAYAWHIGESGRRAGVAEFGPVTREEFLALRASDAPMFAVASSVVFRAGEARAAGGFRARMAPAEDADLWTRMSDRTVALILPRKLTLYRVHAASSSTTRFFRQMALTGLIAENAARRRAGRPELAPEEWDRLLRARPLGQRLRRARAWHSRRLYRIAGGMLADGRPAGALYLAGAAALAPVMVVRRLRRQRRLRPQVAPRLRRT